MIKTISFYGIVIVFILIWSPWNNEQFSIELYHYLYLSLALVIWLVGYHFFGGRFIRPKWKIPGKLIAYLLISTCLLIWIGHFALIFIIGHQLSGGIGHFIICKKHGIDWKTCQPEEKYLELTEKWAKGDFS